MPAQTVRKNAEKNTMPKLPPLRIDNAKIIWRNFAGAQKTFNAAGLRNFHVVLDAQTAKMLTRDGWNVKEHQPKEAGEDIWYSLKVAVRYDNYPPSVILKNKDVSTPLDEKTIDLLDWAEILSLKLMINGSRYETATAKGVKAYLSRMIVTISDNDLDFSGVEVSKPATTSPVSNKVDKV